MKIVFARFASETCSRCSGSDGHVIRSTATDVSAMCRKMQNGDRFHAHQNGLETVAQPMCPQFTEEHVLVTWASRQVLPKRLRNQCVDNPFAPHIGLLYISAKISI